MHQLKYLEICIFYCLWGSPLNFDKEKWHYIYIAQFLKKEFLIFLAQFFDLNFHPCHKDTAIIQKQIIKIII